MLSLHTNAAAESRLRIVFDDKVESLSMLADVTFGDIAYMLRQFPRWRYGSPVALDITLGSGERLR